MHQRQTRIDLETLLVISVVRFLECIVVSLEVRIFEMEGVCGVPPAEPAQQARAGTAWISKRGTRVPDPLA